MKHREHVRVLEKTLRQLNEGASWLGRSVKRCQRAAGKSELSAADLDAFEALTSRFARLSDMILQKLFRALDHIELEDSGTLLDALNRAEKRGLVDSVAAFLEIRELRNEIAHEYAQEELSELFQNVLEHSQALLEIVRRADEYCQRYVSR